MEDTVDALDAGALLAPEMVIRRLPRPVATRADKPPAVAPVLNLDSHLAHRWPGLTGGGIKTEIQTRAVEVKVNGSATRPAEIGVSSGESEAGSGAILVATCVKAAGWCRGHVSGRATPAGGQALAEDSFSRGGSPGSVADICPVGPTSLKSTSLYSF